MVDLSNRILLVIEELCICAIFHRLTTFTYIYIHVLANIYIQVPQAINIRPVSKN